MSFDYAIVILSHEINYLNQWDYSSLQTDRKETIKERITELKQAIAILRDAGKEEGK